MTELNQSNENNTNPAEVNKVETTPTTCETLQGSCAWNRKQWKAKCGKGHGKCCRLKVIGGVVLIFLLGVMAGKGCSHHHAHHGAMNEQATVVVRGEKPLPLSAVLDSIQATPEQRAKAADLVY